MFFLYFNVLFSRNQFSSLMDFLHNYICSFLFFVLLSVIFFFFFLFINKFFYNTKNMDMRMMEFMCSFIPIFILWFQIYPSLMLLYHYGSMYLKTHMTVKITGHQWYWSYLIGDLLNLEFDSYGKNLDSVSLGEFRLLEVDNRLMVPFGVNVRFIITSFDVIHSWTLFNMFLKMDAMSGVLNCFNFTFWNIGLYYGSCSEICGVGHSNMPLSLECSTVFFYFF